MVGGRSMVLCRKGFRAWWSVRCGVLQRVSSIAAACGVVLNVVVVLRDSA